MFCVLWFRLHPGTSKRATRRHATPAIGVWNAHAGSMTENMDRVKNKMPNTQTKTPP